MQILREALARMMKDPVFLQNLEIDPQTGDEVREIVANVVNTDPAVVERTRTIMAAVPGGGAE